MRVAQQYQSGSTTNVSTMYTTASALLPLLCPIENRDAFILTLSNVPWDEHVEALADDVGGKWTGDLTARTLTLSLSITNITAIRKLAEAIRKVAGRGRQYSDRNWKWVTRRTADSLQLFADRLKEYRRMGRALVVTNSIA